MIINRVRPLSVGKIAAFLYGIIGLFIGAVIAVFALFGGLLPAPPAPPTTRRRRRPRSARSSASPASRPSSSRRCSTASWASSARSSWRSSTTSCRASSAGSKSTSARRRTAGVRASLGPDRRSDGDPMHADGRAASSGDHARCRRSPACAVRPTARPSPMRRATRSRSVTAGDDRRGGRHRRAGAGHALVGDAVRSRGGADRNAATCVRYWCDASLAARDGADRARDDARGLRRSRRTHLTATAWSRLGVGSCVDARSADGAAAR